MVEFVLYIENVCDLLYTEVRFVETLVHCSLNASFHRHTVIGRSWSTLATQLSL